MAADPEAERRRVLAVPKSNLAAPPQPLGFWLESAGSVCRVLWLGPVSYRPDERVQEPPTKEEREERRTRRALAREMLRQLLAEGPREVRELKKECAAVGVSARTVERAAHALGLVYGSRSEDGRNVYNWALP